MSTFVRIGVALAKCFWAVIYWSCMSAFWLYFVMMGLLMLAMPFGCIAWAIREVPKAPNPLLALVTASIGTSMCIGMAISAGIIMTQMIKPWFSRDTRDSQSAGVRPCQARRRRPATPRRFNWYDAMYHGDRRN